jgi:preprotein translocase subunit SecG
MLRLILTCVQVFSAFVIVGLVLLQRGKGAEAGAGFGAGASGTVFGARGATTALSRATAVFAAIFMLNSLWLAYLGTETSKASEAQKTILDEAAAPAPKAAPGVGGSASPGAGSTPTSAPTSAAPGAPATSTPATSAPATSAPATPPASAPPATQSPSPAPTPAPAPK